MKKTYQWFLYVLLLCSASLTQANTFVMTEQDDVVGQVLYVHPQAGDSLADVALRYDIGYNAIAAANPTIDPAIVLNPQQTLLIPNQFILPPGPRVGIVINLAEYRLYFYPPGDNVVVSMPVGIGRRGWETPQGQTKVVSKQREPVWHPSNHLKATAADKGVMIPDEFPAGADNPLGRYALRLGWPSYLIHGTNRIEAVGRRVSAGCIRMLPEDIEFLFDMVTVGTNVRIINEPVKLGRLKGRFYLEAHQSLTHNKNIVALLVKYNNKRLRQELLQPRGVPFLLGYSDEVYALR